MKSHPEAAKAFLQHPEKVKKHDQALWFVRQKRDAQSKTVPEWEALRAEAEKIKAHTMSRLGFYLEQFEKEAQKNGITVHWAKDAASHNSIVYEILKKHGARKVVKSKSMLTEECGLNPYLEARDITVTDTDLGERIIQLRHEAPSHIVLPAIHLSKEDVAETFSQRLGSEPGNSDPAYLTGVARADLRARFLEADAAITGVNFAVSESGAIVVCTNEGNADMGTSLAKVHIASMGIEKIIPSMKELGLFTRLLARSATGQPITAYTSCYTKPVEGGELHVVIVDNGRSDLLASEHYRNALSCIRCGACLNTCPVYRRSGGHSYSYVIPGPIGATLGAFRDTKVHRSLPYACTLCASCTNICPVKIDLDNQLYHHRQRIVKAGMEPKKQKLAALTAFVMRHPFLFDLSGKAIRLILPRLPRALQQKIGGIWTQHRTLPPLPKESFKERYKKEKDAKPKR